MTYVYALPVRVDKDGNVFYGLLSHGTDPAHIEQFYMAQTRDADGAHKVPALKPDDLFDFAVEPCLVNEFYSEGAFTSLSSCSRRHWIPRDVLVWMVRNKQMPGCGYLSNNHARILRYMFERVPDSESRRDPEVIAKPSKYVVDEDRHLVADP